MVDEINASVGVAVIRSDDMDMKACLSRIQDELFVMGADLSNPDAQDSTGRMTAHMIKRLEDEIDVYEGELEPLKNFIIPGGTPLAASLHVSRTITRRAETAVVALQQVYWVNDYCIKYLNRLSDLFFVMARVANKRGGVADTVWRP